ncbi:hypothetical protein AB0C02_27325 [Micromonospora sp. NPDC048999]|uniref:hypothetical protein n=1 Tax=Micromonospora sp. NPDC048999 TaxID=3155391 RepID=UPI0034039017
MTATAATLRLWLAEGSTGPFPFLPVVRELQRTGKHCADVALLDALAEVRTAVRAEQVADGDRMLRRFLDVALDKHDDRHRYPSYTALSLFDLPSGADAGPAQRRADRLVVGLVGDVLRFETAALAGRGAMLPRMRPGPDLVAKRCRHGLRVLSPALNRLGVARADLDAPRAVREAARVWVAGRRPVGPDPLRLSMLPVDTIHDEHLFIRVLQTFEVSFALTAVRLHATVAALDADDPGAAARHLDTAATTFGETAPLFALLATMRVEAFRTFRTFTDGASAIQSDGYKTMESLCRPPDPARLASAAYDAVPEVRARVAAGVRTIDEAVDDLRRRGGTVYQVHAAQERFARAWTRWRHTHHRLAARMLGDVRGTGYTVGVPYLASVVDIPVFRGLPG